MTKFTALFLLSFSTLSFAGIDVIYGKDERKEFYETTPALKKLAKATAGLVDIGSLKMSYDSDKFTIPGLTTLGDFMKLCPSEKFFKQPVVTICSGFLISEDILVTAGHCLIGKKDSPESICSNSAWIFDFALTSKSTNPTKNFSMDNTYSCAEVIEAKLDKTNDYAVIRLAKRVTGREPLKYRQSGKVSATANLVAIGHPNGLPLKVSEGGKIIDNSGSTRFVASLDTFQGSSGGAVIDADTGMLEGIVIQGKRDYALSDLTNLRSCQTVNVCDDKGLNCTNPDSSEVPGEMVTRITSLSKAIEKAFATH